MIKGKNDTLFSLVHDYLKIYLPKQRNVSPNTIRSYRKALEELLDYVKELQQIPLSSVTFEHLTADVIFSFLEYSESEHGWSVSTRNARFAAIRVFIEYAADRDLALVDTLIRLRKIPFKKPGNVNVVGYMSMEAITAIIDQTDTNTSKGLRDRFFIILLYDTGARIQEILDIRLCDFQLGRFPKVTLFGKGRKTRIVPLMDKTIQHLKKYLTVFHTNADSSAELPLFYSLTHGVMHPLTSRMAQYILQKYGEKAKLVCPEVPEKVHPHLIRHSRAMHLYQEGMDLTLIAQWLGHSHLDTTQIYAHADTEHKRKAIAAATPADNPLSSKLNSARYTVTDEETLKKLTGLR